jgi:hypothetical protein
MLMTSNRRVTPDAQSLPHNDTAVASVSGETYEVSVQTSAQAGSAWVRLVAHARTLFTVAAIVVAWGYYFPTDLYLTPERGLGYALGIIGGTMMLLLLIYPARKRVRQLAFIGSVKRWFQIHMFFGIAGPICILFHSNFSLGATNSNVALWSMVIVAASGLVGRYFYARIHIGLHGQRATYEALSAAAARLRDQARSIAFLPELVQRLDGVEAGLRDTRGPWVTRPILLLWKYHRGRRELRRYIHSSLEIASRNSATIAAHQARLFTAAVEYSNRRLMATRRLADLHSFERLFSWWHILHLPLFFMLLIAGTTHVVAVHIY